MNWKIFVLIFIFLCDIIFYVASAGVAELADAHDSKSIAQKTFSVDRQFVNPHYIRVFDNLIFSITFNTPPTSKEGL